jgi:hypothetical protein
VKGLLVFAVALGALLWAASRAGGPDVVCPAIGWGSAVRVELTGDWSAQPVGVVELECSTPCERLTVLDEVTGEPVQLHEAVDPLSWPVFGERPGSAVATVLAPDGSELARVESQLEFERVGGTEECGGPTEATVRVPAP